METRKTEERINIYLVDDDPDHQRLIEKVLSEHDKSFSFRTFTSPREALHSLREEPPDLVISDYLFGLEMNGLLLMQKVREAGLQTPFIFLTGQGNEEVAAEAFRMGAEDYFTKEVGFAHFIRIAQAVRRAAARSRSEIEKKNMHKQYFLAERVCSLLMQEANDFIAVLNRDGRVVSANRMALEMAGYTLEDAIGRLLSDFIAPEDQDRIWNIFGELLACGKQVRTQFTFVTKDGRQRFLDASASCIAPTAEDPQILVIARDITDWRMKENRLLWSQQMMNEVINAMEEIVHVVDRDLKIIYCNEKMDNLSRGRVKSEEIIGRQLLEVFPFLEEMGVIGEYRKVFETGEPLVTGESTEFAGQTIFTRTLKMPVRGRDGRVEKVVTIMRDVTADHLQEEERRRLLQAVDDAMVSIAIADRNDRYVFVNKRGAELHGYASPEELLGKTWRDVTPGEVMERNGKEIFQALEDTGHWVGESLALRKDGRKIPVLLSINRLKDDAGRSQGHICFVQDISREKRMNEELEQKNRELEELNKELGSFVSMTSHELRSPLTNIEGFARLLEEKVDSLPPAEVKDFLSRINANAIRLHRLIEDLILFARERKRKLEYVETGLKEIIDEILGSFAAELKAAAVRVNVGIGVEKITADRQKLFQILKNIIENALIYRRPEEKHEVTVEISRKDDGMVLFRVSDNGPGVLETERESIFEIFRRGSASRGKPGTGVGLALARDNVQKMGGTIWLESTPGSGSDFYFTLPGK